jgi:hypothetical protein
MSARTRWAVPAGVVAAVGIIIGATAVANAAAPSLPARSVAQLLADVQQASARPQGPYTATIQETANLGLPALPQIGAITNQGGQLGALSPLAGTTTVSIWYLNPSHVRLAQPVQMGESDLRLDGNQLWLWNSKTQTATHVVLPREIGNEARSGQQWFNAPNAAHGWALPAPNLTPLAAARQALAQVGPSTRVALGPNVTVAGRPAYQISVSPRTSGSLVSQILIAIDAARHIPLRVEVIARDSSSPAFEVGFTALSFGPPAMSNFSFTPPPGAHVAAVTLPSSPAGLPGLGRHGLGLGALGLSVLGSGLVQPGGIAVTTPLPAAHAWASCAPENATSCLASPGPIPAGPPALPKAALRQIEANFAAHLPKSMTKAQRAAAIKAFEQNFTARITAGPVNGASVNVRLGKLKLVRERLARARAASIIPMSGTGLPSAGPGSPKVLGRDWTSVFVTPANPAVAAMVQRLLAAAHQAPIQQSSGFVGSSSQAAPAPGSLVGGPVPVGPVPVGPDLAVLRALLQATTPVHGSWGSGRLLQSALLSVLVTSKGQVLAGAVTPSVLYADAASLSR